MVDGNIPDELATQWCFSTLDSMLTGIATRAASIPAHYDAAHEVLYRPDGTPIGSLAP